MSGSIKVSFDVSAYELKVRPGVMVGFFSR